jgi:diguanylate cyclase
VSGYERENALAKAAMEHMAACKVAPTPANFELFYTYANGVNPDLKRTIDEITTTGRAFTAPEMESLHKRFMRRDDMPAEIDQLASGMRGALAAAQSTLEAAGRDTQAYGATLSAATGELGGNNPPGDIRKVMDGLLSATQMMEQRAKTLEDQLQNSSREVDDLKVKLDSVRRESLTDPLTNIANRKSFDMQLKRAISDSRLTGEPMALLMCDIDRFKLFNDNFGHQTGDQVLRLVAACFTDNLKGQDIPARYGGEEFVVVLPKTALKDAVSVAEKIRATVQTKRLIKRSTGDVLGTITISIGVSELSASDVPETLIKRADACLYAAKNAGRNCVIAERDAAANSAAA